jgi:hypothetical protein
MAGYPPPVPPPGYDARAQRRYFRDQARAQRDAIRAQAQQVRYQMRSQRRGSILAPLLLIAIGVLFLLMQTGTINRHNFWAWYGHWWPLLLVIAGVVVLAEWAFDQYSLRDPGRPAYRRSIGGGVVFLLILLGVTGVFAGHAVGFHPWDNGWFNGFQLGPDGLDEFMGDKHESDQTVDVAFPAGSTLNVVNPRGDVTISGTSDDNTVHIACHKQIYTRTDSEADSRAQQFVPQTNTDGSAIKVTMPKMDGARADLILTVPASATTSVNTNRGDIHVVSIKAPVSAIANHGDIELSAITGAVTAHINSGSSSITAHSIGGGIKIEGHAGDVNVSDITGSVALSGDFFGTIHIGKIAGPIHFHTSRTDFQLARLDGEIEISPNSGLSADQAVGPVVLTTRDRNINLERFAGDVSVTNRNGTINLTAAPTIGNITLENRNGSIKTTLPERANFSVQANTTDGNIDTDLQVTAGGTENHKSVTGSIGSGGPQIRIATTNGDISIHRAEIAAMPPMPPAPPRITLTPTEPAGPAPRAPRPARPPHAPAPPVPTE